MQRCHKTSWTGAAGRMGFTLLEVMIAFAIMGLVVGGTMASFWFGIRSYHEDSVVNELNINLELAVENLRKDIRLSSLCLGGNMAFYPEDADEYTAISMPIALDDDGDNLLERDSNGKISWDQTVIYHVRPGTPDQLVRVVFSPKDTNATPAEIYQQLVDVVNGDTVSAALDGETYSSRVVFENLVDLKIKPVPTIYDGYSETNDLEEGFNFGSVVIGPSNHTLRLTCQGKNVDSSGYLLGVDRFSMTPSDASVEGEFYLESNPYGYFTYAKSAGSTVTNEDKSGDPFGRWSGDEQLLFTPSFAMMSTNVPWLEFNVYNDLWLDDTFGYVGGTYARNTAVFSNDYVALQKGLTWEIDTVAIPGTNMTDDTGHANEDISVIFYGSKVGPYPSSGCLMYNGRYVRVLFYGPDVQYTNQSLTINSAEIGEYPATGTNVALTFSSAATVDIPAGACVWSDWIDAEIEKDTSYYVEFNVGPADKDCMRYWYGQAPTNSAVTNSFIDGVASSNIFSVAAVEVRYPDQGIYRSGILDTGVDDARIKTLQWRHLEPNENNQDYHVYGGTLAGDIDMKMRTGTDCIMSNSTWRRGSAQIESQYYAGGATPYVDMPGHSLPPGRWIQYEAFMTCKGAENQYSGQIKDVLIDWEGETGIVNLNMDLGKGPNYGMYGATVDGRELAKALKIDMTIYKDFKFAGRRYTVRNTMTVTPLNTGK